LGPGLLKWRPNPFPQTTHRPSLGLGSFEIGWSLPDFAKRFFFGVRFF